MAEEVFDFDFDTLEEGMVELTPPEAEETTEEKKESKKKDEKKPPESIDEGVEYVEGALPPEEEEEGESKEEESLEEKGKPPSSEDTKESEDASGSFALAFAKFQQDEGVIPEYDEEELKKVIEDGGEIEAFRYLLQKQQDSIYEEAKSTYGSDQQELLEYFELKDAGVDADLAKELMFQKKQFTSLKDEDLAEDEELRKKVMAQHYKMTTKFSDAKIKKLVENSVSLGEDEDEAKEALTELQKMNKEQIEAARKDVETQEATQKQVMQEYKEGLKKKIYETSEIIEGQKINKPTQQKIEKMLMEPVKMENGNVTNGLWAKRAENPQEFDTKMAYFLLTGLFDGKLDSTVKAKTKTNVINQFEKILQTKNEGVKGRKSTTPMESENADMNEFFGKRPSW